MFFDWYVHLFDVYCFVNVIAPRTLRAFWTKYLQAEAPLKVWQKGMQKSTLHNLNEVRALYPSADLASSRGGEHAHHL